MSFLRCQLLQFFAACGCMRCAPGELAAEEILAFADPALAGSDKRVVY